jgi:hypothetical protein
MPKSTKTSTKSVEHAEVVQHVDETTTPTETDEIDNYVEAKNFKIDNFFLKPIEEKMGTKSQYMAFPKIKSKKSKDGDSVIIVTDAIKLTKGGIPKIDGEYKKSDKDREFFWLGEDKTQPACVQLFDGLRKIDETYSQLIADNASSKVIHLNKDGKKEPLDKLEYVSLVRESGTPDNAKDSDKQYEPYDRIKVRFNTKWDADKAEGEPSEITTMLFLLDNENPEPYTSVTDFEKSLRWNCEARFVLHINKFWAMKALKNKKRECGFTVKCLQVYITKQSTSGAGISQVEKFRKRLFAPGSATPAVVHEQPAKSQSTTSSSKKVSKKETSEDSDSDDEPEQKQTKPVGKNAKKQTTSDSETSEESDSSESEESEEKPKKGNPAKNTKGKKQESSSEESESSEQSDSEDEKAKAKSKPAAKPKGKSK